MALPHRRFFSYQLEPTMQQGPRRGKHMTQDHRSHEHSRIGASVSAMTVERDLKVTMRDGVRNLALRLSARRRPTGAGAVRGLALSARVRQAFRLSAVSLARDRTGRNGMSGKATPTCMPTCGSANPKANLDSWIGPSRRLCRADRVDRQPAWCSGRVGGIGQSYYAMAQWLMATAEPARPRMHRAV